MPRYIDADALYKDICDSLNEMTRIGIVVDGELLWGKLNDSLENAPTADVVEVVRCKNCKHCTRFERFSGTIDFICENGDHVFPDGFCSGGERREDD